ncbi:MAG TPA: condensation domain-containing protein, partial [Methanocorpusculum sp.]|nr:condensation domain-containing protein [Methanocorpusculum sp.]
ALPYNQNMKVNRKALPVPELTDSEAIPPQNEIQQKLFDIVAKVLGHSGFGINTSFSDTGLDSIRAVKLLMLLGNEFNVPIKYTDIRQCDTIEKLEAFFRNIDTSDTEMVYSDYPLLETQKVIYNACMQHPKSALYHIPTLIRLNESVNPLMLKEAIEKAINTHPYLKSCLISADNGTVRIKRNDEAEPVVSIIHVRSEDAENILPELYDIFRSRLYNAAIYTTEYGNYLLLDVHHIIFDGMSLAILLRDITSAYSGTPLLPEVYSGFDAANDEEKARTDGRYNAAMEYYNQLFAGQNIISYLQATEDIAGHSASIRYVTEKLTVDAVQRYCSENHLTENAFFNAAFGLVLSRYADRSFVFSSLYHGRGDSRLINTTAMLAKRLPVLCAVPKDGTAAEFIMSIQEQIMNSMEYDLCSYSYLNEKYGIDADVILRYQGFGFTSSGSELGDIINPTLYSSDFEDLMKQYEVPMSSLGVSIFIEDNNYEIIAHKSDVYSHEFVEMILVMLEDTALSFLSSKEFSNT